MSKKTALTEFSNPRKSGIIAIGLAKGDRLIDARLTDGSQDIVIGTREGMAIRFHEQEVRVMGRGASGVRAVRLGKHDRVVGAVALRKSGTTILVATEGGYGKRSETSEYRVSHRGGKGIITVKTTDKTGKMVAIREVVETDDVVVVTSNGIVIRQHASEIRVAGRNTQGVRLIRLDEKDHISDVAAVAAEEEMEAKVESVTNNLVKNNENKPVVKEPPKAKPAATPAQQPSTKGKQSGKQEVQRGGKKKKR
jgi:DNA gyrase subunit A